MLEGIEPSITQLSIEALAIWTQHINLAGMRGIEPLSRVLETQMLPLHHTPITLYTLYLGIY